MADQIYKVRDPSGAIREIKGPSGASDEDVIAQAKKLFSGPERSLVDQIPGMPAEQPKPAPEPMLGEKAEGLAQAGLGAATGAAAAPVGAFAGLLKGLTGGKLGTPEGVQEADATRAKVSEALTFQPRTAPGREYLAGFGRFLEDTGVAGLGPVAGEAAGVRGAPVAAMARKGVEAVKSAGKKAVAAVTPEIAEDTANLARKAQAMGLKIPLDALGDNRVVKFLGQAFREVPLSGSMTAENRAAFNRAILTELGGDGDKITPQAFGKAMDRSGKAIGDISAKNPVPYDAPLIAKLEAQRAQVANFEPDPGIQRVVNAYLDQIKNAGAAKGQIDGTAMRKIRTQLTSQMRTTGNGDLKHALSELDESLLDAVQGQLSPKELSEFNKARYQYGFGKTIEPLVAKAAVKGSGDMSPAAFAQQLIATKQGKAMMARGRGGPAGDIAAVGNRFLTEPGSSGTTERGLAYSALGGSGLAGGVPAAAGVWGAANLYNRLGPRISRRIVGEPFKDMVETAQP